jgi:hypothetical protein
MTTTISIPEPKLRDAESGEPLGENDVESHPRVVITQRISVWVKGEDEPRPAECTLSVDIRGLAGWLGATAWRNPTHTTQALNSSVVARVRLLSDRRKQEDT